MDERTKIKFMNLNLEKLKKKFGNNIIFSENLSKYSWFNLGGPADIFFRPNDKIQLLEFISEINQNNYDIQMLGAGSNTLIRDKGVRGAVIKLSSKFSDIHLIDKETINVGAASLDRRVSDFAKNHNIGDMEFLSCIPGSIGGGVIMNSGCYGSNISDILLSIQTIDIHGNEKEIKKDAIEFSYRGTNLPKNHIITSVKLRGSVSEKLLIEKKQDELIHNKKSSQPNQVKTGGSTFKNNNDKKAWMLIKESGCDKFSVGDAKISEKHCNFFINNGKAKASDIEKLINNVKKEVFKKTGVSLELEIKIIGE